MADHHKRFELWRRKLPKHTRYLVDQVLTRIVPEFEARGLKWYSDFAGGDIREIADHEIPLQLRERDEWPTAQISFDKKLRPCFAIDFALLPPICRRAFGMEEVSREKAIVVYAPAYFMLCKGKHRSLDGQFGYRYFSLSPYRRLDAEVNEAVSLLPVLFDLFDQGIPADWLERDFGYVHKHVMLMGSWHMFSEQRRKRGETATGNK